MAFARPSNLYAIPGVARKVCAGLSTKQFQRTIGRRQYASAGDTAREATHSSSKIPWMLGAGVIIGGGTYLAGAFTPQSPTPQPDGTYSKDTNTKSSANAEEPSTIPSHPGDLQAEKNRRKAEYEDDHPKPVEDRHGDTVKKHSIAAKKNQMKVRVGKFSKEEFDNHIQSHSPDPCDDFEKLEKEKEEAKKEEAKK